MSTPGDPSAPCPAAVPGAGPCKSACPAARPPPRHGATRMEVSPALGCLHPADPCQHPHPTLTQSYRILVVTPGQRRAGEGRGPGPGQHQGERPRQPRQAPARSRATGVRAEGAGGTRSPTALCRLRVPTGRSCDSHCGTWDRAPCQPHGLCLLRGVTSAQGPRSLAPGAIGESLPLPEPSEQAYWLQGLGAASRPEQH